MKFEIQKEQMDEIVNYLVQRPFAEVFQLMSIVQKLKVIPAEEKKAE